MYCNMRANRRLRPSAPSRMPLSPRHSDTPYLRPEVFERCHLEAAQEAPGARARPCRTCPEGIATRCHPQKGRGRCCRSKQHPACCLAPTLSHAKDEGAVKNSVHEPEFKKQTKPLECDPSPKSARMSGGRDNHGHACGCGGSHGWTQSVRSAGCVWKARAWRRLLHCTPDSGQHARVVPVAGRRAEGREETSSVRWGAIGLSPRPLSSR